MQISHVLDKSRVAMTKSPHYCDEDDHLQFLTDIRSDITEMFILVLEN